MELKIVLPLIILVINHSIRSSSQMLRKFCLAPLKKQKPRPAIEYPIEDSAETPLETNESTHDERQLETNGSIHDERPPWSPPATIEVKESNSHTHRKEAVMKLYRSSSAENLLVFRDPPTMRHIARSRMEESFKNPLSVDLTGKAKVPHIETSSSHAKVQSQFPDDPIARELLNLQNVKESPPFGVHRKGKKKRNEEQKHKDNVVEPRQHLKIIDL